MLAYTYIEQGKFELLEKQRPQIKDSRDAIVRVTLSSICTSDLHIKHGSVPRALPGITVGHEMVGIVEEIGIDVGSVKPGDRVTVNVETFCGECFFCRRGYVNNCTDPDGGWALGCRIDGGQAEYVRVPYADRGFPIPLVTNRLCLSAMCWLRVFGLPAFRRFPGRIQSLLSVPVLPESVPYFVLC